MKKQINSLTIQPNKTQRNKTAGDRLSALLPGSLLLMGFWGMFLQELGLEMQHLLLLIPAFIMLTGGLLLQWDKPWQALTAIGVLTLMCVVCAVFHKPLSSGIAGLMEHIHHWWLLRTGTYILGYEAEGSVTAVLCLGFTVSGIVTAWFTRRKTPLMQLLVTLVVLTAWMCGLLESGWWLAAYMIGMLMLLAGYASQKGLRFTSVVALVLAMMLVGMSFFVGTDLSRGTAGEDLSRRLHAIFWERAENPLPEGELTNLGAYQPTNEAAMEVTMEHWTPLYLRGFVAGNYTDTGWQSVDGTVLSENGETLYTLQESYFFASDQLSNAWQSVETEADNSVSVRVLEACRENAYFPYGVGDITGDVLTASDLQGEGMSRPEDEAYTAQLYPVEESYLLQSTLQDVSTGKYRSGESAYRTWVYDEYLTIPEDAYEVLTRHFSVEEGITTVQAKREITQLLAQVLTYQETVLTDTGERDFLSYVLEVSKAGYSVHYATLATLLLRCCGIPARYVEGYLVTPSQAEALADGETLSLTQSNAHAWTEYYLDGVGWLPFDATPGYTDILVYELPQEGVPTQESGGGIQYQEQEPQEDTPTKTPQVAEETTKESQRIHIREAISLLLLILLLMLLLLILRTVLLRRRLGRQQMVFGDSDCRKACAGILCYMKELTAAIGIVGENLTVRELAMQMTRSLDSKVDAGALETMLNEVWYSSHSITTQQRETALAWLETAQQAWKQKVPAGKRFQQRFITCRIK